MNTQYECLSIYLKDYKARLEVIGEIAHQFIHSAERDSRHKSKLSLVEKEVK
jgi:hypothetical protein